MIKFILGYFLGIITILFIDMYMKTKIFNDEDGKKIFQTSINQKKNIYVIRTNETFYGLKSKLFCNSIFVKDLNKRNLQSYSNELKKELHKNAINIFLTKY